MEFFQERTAVIQEFLIGRTFEYLLSQPRRGNQSQRGWRKPEIHWKGGPHANRPMRRSRFGADVSEKAVVNDLTLLDSMHDDVLLNELEAMHLAKRPQSAMPWCVIEHSDKGKREFHFVIPLYDLLFGKVIHPYVDKIDRNAFRFWVEHFALRYNLDFPHEKLRVKPAFEHLRSLRKCDREFLEGIWNHVDALVQEKRVKTREDLERQLTKMGHKARFTKHTGGGAHTEAGRRVETARKCIAS